MFHNDYAGHAGINRTIDRLRSYGHDWPNIREDVKAFVQRCLPCQIVNYNTHPNHGHRFQVLANRPFQRTAIDALGPLNGDHKYKHIVTIIDCMSRFVRLFPVESLTANEFTPILEQYITQYSPESVVFDNGKQFANRAVDALLQLFHIPRDRLTPYSKEENALVERANGTIRRHMEKWTFSNPNVDWSRYLPYVERIMNNEPIEGLSVSPNDIIFSRSPSRRAAFTPSVSEHIAHITSFQDRICKEHDALLKRKQDVIDKHNALHPIMQYPPGTLVLVSNPNKLKQFDSFSHIGPFAVIRQQGNQVVLTKPGGQGTVRPVHISRIKLYHSPNETNLGPDQAHLAGSLFQIAEVVTHQTTADGAHNFTILWSDDAETTEENLIGNPSLRISPLFQKYCAKHPELAQYLISRPPQSDSDP